MSKNLSPKERDNLLRWDGNRRGWYEVYFLKFNDQKSRTAGWLRYTLTSPHTKIGSPYCELWGIFFDVENPKKNFAVKQRHAIEQLSWDRDRFKLGIADAALGLNACHGAINDTERGRSLSWELKFDSATPSLRHYPFDWMYTAGFPKTKLTSPHLDARFSGNLTVDDRTISLNDVPGQQSHMWGTQHGLRWAWGHCNTFKDHPGSVWEGLDAQVKVGPVPSPHMKLFYLKTGGREYLFNRPVQLFRNTSSWELGRWTFECRNKEIRIKGEVTSDFAEFVGVTYTDPDGKQLWCNNSKVASLKIELFHPDGRKLGELEADRSAAAEYVDRRTYPQVPIQI